MDDKGLVATLTQNVPNPFTTDTRISYTIPFQYQSAKIGVYDLNGQELKLLTLNAPIGEVIIQGGKLKPGMYIYTLIVDGKTLSSKKMTLTSF
ncbi:MAG: T9SS type A sorting domain-containing protein [Bacteroidetes bacterium]|nr:T9SS type A sorting domain-containing protein [Bacteroidota bacterium]